MVLPYRILRDVQSLTSCYDCSDRRLMKQSRSPVFVTKDYFRHHPMSVMVKLRLGGLFMKSPVIPRFRTLGYVIEGFDVCVRDHVRNWGRSGLFAESLLLRSLTPKNMSSAGSAAVSGRESPVEHQSDGEQ